MYKQQSKWKQQNLCQDSSRVIAVKHWGITEASIHSIHTDSDLNFFLYLRMCIHLERLLYQQT